MDVRGERPPRVGAVGTTSWNSRSKAEERRGSWDWVEPGMEVGTHVVSLRRDRRQTTRDE